MFHACCVHDSALNCFCFLFFQRRFEVNSAQLDLCIRDWVLPECQCHKGNNAKQQCTTY